MRSEQDIDRMIDSFIQRERNIGDNPFLSTRVMASIERRDRARRRSYGAWQTVAMSVGLVAAIAVGIKTGTLYHNAPAKMDQGTVVLVNDDKMEHFVFYQETVNE